jgi:pyrroloquinoline quinone (PQQ) biosynthesis protein C
VGHEDWILQDIEHAGGDAAAVRNSQPSHATDVMVAYAYDGVQRRNPLIFFGMGFVLEGTSVQLATRAADQLMTALDLPPKAFTYLTSHGEIDREHTKDFESLVNRFDDAQDRTDVTQAANSFYRLYADVFGEIERVVA